MTLKADDIFPNPPGRTDCAARSRRHGGRRAARPQGDRNLASRTRHDEPDTGVLCHRYGTISLHRTAWRTSCAVECTFSLRIDDERWVSTVLTLMSSRYAMLLLLFPSAIRRTTSRSRAVSAME